MRGNVKVKDPRARFVNTLLLDVGLPLGLFYGLRLMGVDQWLALVVSAVVPVLRLTYVIVAERRIERLTLFTMSLVLASVAVSWMTSDPRLLLARESYFTALIGAWILATLLAERPMIYTATTKLMPSSSMRWLGW